MAHTPRIANLQDYLESRVVVELRDKRTITGLLRSFDQFGNALLEDAQERLIHCGIFAELPLGIFVVRGENIALIGQVDTKTEAEQTLVKRRPYAEVLEAMRKSGIETVQVEE